MHSQRTRGKSEDLQKGSYIHLLCLSKRTPSRRKKSQIYMRPYYISILKCSFNETHINDDISALFRITKKLARWRFICLGDAVTANITAVV
jgi:hypothetical protein